MHSISCTGGTMFYLVRPVAPSDVYPVPAGWPQHAVRASESIPVQKNGIVHRAGKSILQMLMGQRSLAIFSSVVRVILHI